MLTRILQQDAFPPRLGITAALSGEGVTYISHALGLILANDTTASVCVVDLNWWTESGSLNPAGSGGVAAVVAGDKSVDDALVSTNCPNLMLLPAGKLSQVERPRVARSEELARLLDDLKEQFDHLIFDIPPILVTSDAIALAGFAGTCALVTQQGVTSIDNVRQALDDINHLKVLGVILNQVDTHTPELLLNFIPQD